MVTSIRYDDSQLRAKLVQIWQWGKNRAPEVAANSYKIGILYTTASGNSPRGYRYRDYTSAYKRRKIRRLGSADPVNLRGEGFAAGGGMLRSIYWDKDKKALTLPQSENQQKKAQGNSRLRPFLIKSPALNRDAKIALVKSLDRELHPNV
jgi:hypothetical protein